MKSVVEHIRQVHEGVWCTILAMDENLFAALFHASSKQHAKGHAPIPQDTASWPDEWKTTYYKTYPRFERIPLAASHPPDANLFEVLTTRSSKRTFSAAPIRAEELSLLLKYGCGNTTVIEDGRFRRSYPSAGGRYPLEAYLFIRNDGEGVPAGIHHYAVKDHALEVLQRRSFSAADLSSYFTYSWAREASVLLALTATFWRNQGKYGERGYRYILLEAGHAAQNISLVAEALGLKSVCMGGSNDGALESLLDIDGVEESVVYTIALGR